MMQIRRATVEDAELLSRLNAPVQQIHHEARPDLFKPPTISAEMIADFRNRLLDDRVTILIGDVNGEPIGYILAQIVERADNPYTYRTRTLLVDQMSVNPEARSHGYGDRLMRAVFELAKSLGFEQVMLSVGAFNTRAIAFYERQGFAPRDLRMYAPVE